MKTTLLLFVFAMFGIQAQTTYNLDWEMGIGTNIDLTIKVGDKVKWNWTDEFPHTVQSDAGSTETFNSGTKTGIGSSYLFTFSVIGTNPYHCGFHPFTMAGTITVENALGVEAFSLKDFSVSPNPASTELFLKLPQGISVKTISIYDILGKQLYSNNHIESSINIARLTKGMYFLRVSSENISHTKRFIKS